MNIGEILKNQMIAQEESENNAIERARTAFNNGGEIVVKNKYFTESFTKLECDFYMVEKAIRNNDFNYSVE